MRYRLLRRLHLAVSLAVAVPLLVLSLTGALPVYAPEIQRLVSPTGWSVPMAGETLSRVERPEPAPFEGLRPIADLGEALSLAMAEAPEAELRTIRPPDTPGAPLIATLFAPDQTAPTRIWFGDDPARVLFVRDGREITATTWIWHMRYMLHVSDFAGPLVRTLWVLMALAPAGFVISGLWLHLGR